MLTWLGYIDGIHGAPYIPAPWIRHGSWFQLVSILLDQSIEVDPSVWPQWFWNPCRTCFMELQKALSAMWWILTTCLGRTGKHGTRRIGNIPVGWEHGFYDFPFSWECHHPNWRTHVFQRGRAQPPTSICLVAERHVYVCLVSSNIVVCFISTGKYSICIVGKFQSHVRWTTKQKYIWQAKQKDFLVSKTGYILAAHIRIMYICIHV